MAGKTIIGNVVHTEFASKDADATCKFLGDVFGLQFENGGTPESGDYWMFGSEEDGVGGAVRPLMPEDQGHAYSAPYIGVEDIDATIAAAEAAGAEVMVPKVPIPGMGWFAWFQAPGGVVVAAWQTDSEAPAPEAPSA